MLPKNSDQNWEAFGKTDPYFGVISEDRFQQDRLDANAKEDFFAGGEEHIAGVIETIRRTVAPDFAPTRCLDFGCGVGRLVIPLARRFPEVVGLDISDSMLAEAKQNAARAGVTNVELLRSDDGLSQANGHFDLVHSFIVLQHIPKSRGEELLRLLIGKLGQGGVGALHFTYYNDLPKYMKLHRWLRETVPFMHYLFNLTKGRRFNTPYMMMENYDINRLIRIIKDEGITDLHMEMTHHGFFYGVMLYFQKQ